MSTLVHGADVICVAPDGPAGKRVRAPGRTGEQYPADIARAFENSALTGASTDASRLQAGDATLL